MKPSAASCVRGFSDLNVFVFEVELIKRTPASTAI
jgi:hypothetical protein